MTTPRWGTGPLAKAGFAAPQVWEATGNAADLRKVARQSGGRDPETEDFLLGVASYLDRVAEFLATAPTEED